MAKQIESFELLYSFFIEVHVSPHTLIFFCVHIFQEKDAEHKYSHVIINSASSSSSGSKFTGHEVSLPASLSPFIRSLQKRSPKTEAHPNALKNINKDYTLLHASIKGIINPNEGYKLSQRSRSLSTLDFRNLDQERISKLYWFNKDQAFKNDAFFSPPPEWFLVCAIYLYLLWSLTFLSCPMNTQIHNRDHLVSNWITHR